MIYSYGHDSTSNVYESDRKLAVGNHSAYNRVNQKRCNLLTSRECWGFSYHNNGHYKIEAITYIFISHCKIKTHVLRYKDLMRRVQKDQLRDYISYCYIFGSEKGLNNGDQNDTHLERWTMCSYYSGMCCLYKLMRVKDTQGCTYFLSKRFRIFYLSISRKWKDQIWITRIARRINIST